MEVKNLYWFNGERTRDLRDGDRYPSVSAPFRRIEATKTGFGFTVGKSKFVPDISTNQRAARWTHALKKEQRNGAPPPSAEEMDAMLARMTLAATKRGDVVDYSEPDPELDDSDEVGNSYCGWFAEKGNNMPTTDFERTGKTNSSLIASRPFVTLVHPSHLLTNR